MKGVYKAIAFKCHLGLSSTGKEQMSVSFQILEGPDKGKTLTWYGYFTPNTQDKTMETLRTCGWTGGDFSDLSGIDRNEVELVVEEETYNGRVRDRIRWVNKIGGGKAQESLSHEQIAVLNQRVKSLMASKPPSPPSVDPDDKMPF